MSTYMQDRYYIDSSTGNFEPQASFDEAVANGDLEELSNGTFYENSTDTYYDGQGNVTKSSTYSDD